MKNKHVLTVLFLLMVLLPEIKAQYMERSIVSTSSGTSSFNNIQAQWTIGEAFIHSFADTGYHATSGFQQRMCIEERTEIIFDRDTGYFCWYEAPILLNFAYPLGGVWAGMGVSYNNNEYFFSPGLASIGNNLVYYRYFDTIQGCEGIDSVFFSVSSCTGVSEEIEAVDITLYPVPANDFLAVKGVLLPETVEVINISGQIFILNTNENRVDVDKLPNGVYFIKIKETFKPFNIQR